MATSRVWSAPAVTVRAPVASTNQPAGVRCPRTTWFVPGTTAAYRNSCGPVYPNTIPAVEPVDGLTAACSSTYDSGATASGRVLTAGSPPAGGVAEYRPAVPLVVVPVPAWGANLSATPSEKSSVTW